MEKNQQQRPVPSIQEYQDEMRKAIQSSDEAAKHMTQEQIVQQAIHNSTNNRSLFCKATSSMPAKKV